MWNLFSPGNSRQYSFEAKENPSSIMKKHICIYDRCIYDTLIL